MKRRKFITLLGGATAAWPLAARAQQGERMRRVGMISGIADEAVTRARLAAFLPALQRLGWTEGRNVQFEYRWGNGDTETLRKDAAELAALAPDVIVATGGATTTYMLQATHTMPIVFVIVPDPVGSGSVQADRRDRPRFWYDVTRKLDQCRLSREERNRIKSAIAKKIGGKVPTKATLKKFERRRAKLMG